ncbi:hypothetical protein [Nocardioides sp. YIM 152588]|uniref:hypothetical protein n=1 Tax=Nocardioides sp. YIM 152588 TaxID=3158259 RepID=UPI0032E4AF0A
MARGTTTVGMLLTLALLIPALGWPSASARRPPDDAYAQVGVPEGDRGGAAKAASVSLRPVDGAGQGPFTGRPPIAKGAFYPIAVWFESVITPSDVRKDEAAGLNTYLELTADSRTDLATEAGMRVVASNVRMSPGAPFLLPDEVDMWAGPGDDPWTGSWPEDGQVCIPADGACGYTIVDQELSRVPDSTWVYGQFGKGVMMWQTRAQARRFVNTGTHAASSDLYWFTDPNICGSSEAGWFLGIDGEVPEQRCRVGFNYGKTVQRMRSLVRPRGRIPIWVFVEVGTPFDGSGAVSITPGQIRDAVWSGIIHGARGVAYFNHNFGGDCLSQHVLRETCGNHVRPAVTKLNNRISRRARLLNAPFVDGLVKVTGKLDVSVKLHRGRFVLLVGRKANGSVSGTITFRCGKPVRAVDGRAGSIRVVDRRTLPLDLTSRQSIRILKLDGGHTCGLTD